MHVTTLRDAINVQLEFEGVLIIECCGTFTFLLLVRFGISYLLVNPMRTVPTHDCPNDVSDSILSSYYHDFFPLILSFTLFINTHLYLLRKKER